MKWEFYLPSFPTTYEEEKSVKPLQKEEKEQEEESSRFHYYCPRCKNKQAIPNQMVYDFTKGKHSHPGGITAFICTECRSLMIPMEKEDV